jgi:hypothetical protein
LPEDYYKKISSTNTINETHSVMKYGIYQSTILQDMPPINTLKINGYEFCITDITKNNESTPCMKCPDMRKYETGSVNFALYGQLLTDSSVLSPNKKMEYFRHIIRLDVSSGYGKSIYFNGDTMNTVEYAMQTQLDLKSMTFIEGENDALTLSFERSFQINNRQNDQIAQITLNIDGKNSKILILRVDLPMTNILPGDKFLYDPEIMTGVQASTVNLSVPGSGTIKLTVDACTPVIISGSYKNLSPGKIFVIGKSTLNINIFEFLPSIFKVICAIWSF